MDKGRVVHFEDNDGLRETIARSISMFSDERHQVIGGAANLTGALALLDEIHTGAVNANVVLLDGNLTPAVGGSDARKIRQRIRELDLPVRVIGASGETMEANGVEVDIDLGPKMIGFRPSLTGSKIVEAIDSLEDPQTS